jgi:P4 family phage/plasmid primase-like protien
MTTGDPLSQSPAVVNTLTPYRAALWYQARGLHPIPWVTTGGKKIVALGKFNYDAYTSDPNALSWIMDQWAYHAEWQVGLALHENTGVFAIDVDSREQMARWEGEHGPVQDGTWIQRTGRDGGGEHRLFRLEGRGAVWPKQGSFDRSYPNLEFRSNGFIGVSPSIHPSGRQYQWTTDSPITISNTDWRTTSLIGVRAARKEQSIASGASHTRVQADGTRAVVADIDTLLLHGVPAGQSQHAVLRDLAWDAVSRGMSDVMVRVLWDTVVARTPLSRPDQPWTSADFDRHLSSAREKLGGGIDPDLMRWAVMVHNAPNASPDPRPEPTEGAPATVAPEKLAGTQTVKDALLRPLAYAELKEYGPHQTGMGQLFVDRFHEVFRWCNDENSYYIWHSFNGERVTKWHREAYVGVSPKFVHMVRVLSGIVKDCVNRHIASIDESTADGRQKAKDARAYLTPFQKADTLRGITKIVASDQRVSITPDAFTPKSYLLNFLNGTYNVRTGELYEHRREDMIIHTINRNLDMDLAKKDLGENAPLFESMIRRMCAAPGEVSPAMHDDRVTAVKRWLGYQLHGSNPEKKLAVFEGATSIGKNQVVEALGDILAEYAYTSCPPSLLVRSRQDRHSSVEAGLAGKRLVIVNELTKGQVLDEGQVLRLVNPEGTRVDLRKMRENAVSVETTWKLTVTTNAMPRTDTTDQIIQRLAFFPMSQIPVPIPDRDPSLKERILKNESDAILAHAVAWWRQWWIEHEAGNRNALCLPQEASETLAGFVEDNVTPFEEFADEQCYVQVGNVMDAKEVWRRAVGYWEDQHRDKRLEYSGGRKELFKVVSEIPGVERITKGTKKNLVGFRNLNIRALYTEVDRELNSWATSVSS